VRGQYDLIVCWSWGENIIRRLVVVVTGVVVCLSIASLIFQSTRFLLSDLCSVQDV